MINHRFEIIRQIGKGRSEVFLCKDFEISRKEVAVKFLPRDVDNNELSSFRNEYFLLQNLDHPNIIKAFDFGETVKVDQAEPIDVGSHFISLEYFDSVELFKFKYLKDERNLKEIIKQLCSVLYYLHQSNYIYYDLKPENILVSSISDTPQIKLIDLGLAEAISDKKEDSIKGTAQYIAPELLKKEEHDFRVDLYSLGMILYEIIYERLPFETDDELDIYKAQIGQEFNFPEHSLFSSELVTVVKKLLEKDPGARYKNALQVIYELGLKITESVYHDFVPAKVLSSRQDLVNILSNYINDTTSSEVFTIKGFAGSGKSSLINKMYEIIPDSILIRNTHGISGMNLIRLIIKRIIFFGEVYNSLDENEKDLVSSFINKSEKEFIDGLNSVISILTSKSKFTFLVDDYNSFDRFTGEMLMNVIPLLQVNGIKVIVTESSDLNYVSGSINNLREVSVGSLTERQLSDFLQIGFFDQFPRNELKAIILHYADLLPGNIMDFIRDLIKLQIIYFDAEGASINKNIDKLTGLEGPLSTVYNLRISNLSRSEINAAKVISALEINVEQKILAILIGIDNKELNNILAALQFNNIIQELNTNPSPVITSIGLKKHIYSLIDNKEKFHSELSDKISINLPEFNKNEFARQFELAKRYDEAYSVWLEEMHRSKELSAYSYIRIILEHLLELPLDNIIINEVKYLLVETLYKLSDYNTALEIIEQVDIGKLSQEIILELYIIKGSSLIGAGRLEEGRDLIKSLIPKVGNEKRKNNLLVEIAYAKFDLNKIEDATEMCREILGKSELSEENRGRIYNLLGMCVIYRDQPLKDSLSAFLNALECYKNAGLPSKEAAIEVNIGNVYNLIGDSKNAEIYWKKALDLNLSIGNIEQEGILLLNNGIYYYDKTDFGECVKYYKRAYKIFLSLGNNKNQGIVLSNLGEVYLTTCDYQNAFDSLEEARSIFEAVKNLDELIPVLLLSGYFYFTIGSPENLEELYQYTTQLLSNPKLKERFRKELLLLKIIKTISSNEEIEIEELKEVRDRFLNGEDLKNYVTVNTILVNYLIRFNLFAEALVELNHPQFNKTCNENNIYNANREYLLGKVATFFDKGSSWSHLEHFEKAYELLSNESIVEITWKVLFELAQCYGKRGNISKAKDFIIYTRDIITLIAENIESTQFKTAYLQKEERRVAMDELLELERV